ncbi:hypothetical protein N8586_00765 [Verrucomicrobiales bacterium]|nr:hypothetical protein [Verrucomicrobiales bacterium]
MGALNEEYPFGERSDRDDAIGKIGPYVIYSILGDGASSVVFKG